MFLALTVRRGEIAQCGEGEAQMGETGGVRCLGHSAGEGEDADAVVLVVVV